MKLNIKELLTLPTYILTAIAVASGVILFSPEIFIENIHMSNFKVTYGFIIGITFLVTTSILIVRSAFGLFKLLQKNWRKNKNYKVRKKRLNNLNDYQKKIIYCLYTKDNRTALLPLHDGAVRELENYRMIGKVSSIQLVNKMAPKISYMLQPWVVQKLDKDQTLFNSFYESFEKLENEHSNQIC